MRECPTATAEQREDALARYRASKHQGNSVVRSKVVKARQSANTVRINNLVEVVFIPDTGAETSVIPSGVVHSLMALQPDLPLHPRRSGAPVQVVVADSRRLECDCTVDVDLKLNTTAGVVNVPYVNCVVMNSDEEELLLGKDILSDLGINVDDMLVQLAHGADFVDDSDGFDDGDDSLEPRNAEDTQSNFDHLIVQASENGMDAVHLENLREILNQYPDVWQDMVPPHVWSRCVYSCK
jgi:hypothetical protein